MFNENWNIVSANEQMTIFQVELTSALKLDFLNLYSYGLSGKYFKPGPLWWCELGKRLGAVKTCWSLLSSSFM